MIHIIRGLVLDCSDQTIIIDVQGVGYGVTVPQSYSFNTGNTITLHTHTHWNQEQGPQLYGFLTPAEKRTFLLITSCSGIGPKIGLAILANMTPSLFASAIVTADTKALSGVDGIGTKKAESIIVHLKDKVAKLVEKGEFADACTNSQTVHKISAMLGSLHYTKQEIGAALEHLQKTSTLETASFDDAMRKALLFLSKASRGV
jgi:holliday junction DNA helicase RuvA